MRKVEIRQQQQLIGFVPTSGLENGKTLAYGSSLKRPQGLRETSLISALNLPPLAVVVTNKLIRFFETSELQIFAIPV